MGNERAGWALDNVYIGGQEVNSFQLYDDFNQIDLTSYGNKFVFSSWCFVYFILFCTGLLADELYEFYPNSIVDSGICNTMSRVIMWPRNIVYNQNSLTTRELIVAPGHVLQFLVI